MTPLRTLLLYASAGGGTFSYHEAWPRAFVSHARFECVPVDVAARGAWLRTRLAVRRHRLDAVVILHSAFSNACFVRGRLLELIASLPQPKAYFVGNEYKLMPEKLAFSETVGISLLVTQLQAPEAQRLYADRLGCDVVFIPSAGLDERLFAPRVPFAERTIDLGYRADVSPLYLGHDERRLLAERFAEAAARRGLRADVSLDPRDRFSETGWAAFLNACKAQIGSEAGGDYFELTDETRWKVLAYLEEHPGAGLDELRPRFFEAYEHPVSGRALGGRVVEAAGTKTVQLLLEGSYGGFFDPGVHYIPVRKDFADVDEALDKLGDDVYCEALVERAHDVARSELTYERLIGRFADALAPLLR